MRLLLTLLLSTFVLAAAAAEPEDFAVAFPVLLAEEGRLVEVALDARVYRAATTSSLDDLRVFDGQGRPVAHVILPPVAEAAVAAIEVPVFALRRVAAAGRGHRIEVASSGAVIAVLDPEGASAGEQGPRRWLLDASAVDEPIDSLRLSWSLPPEQTMLATVTLEASNDLERWRRIPTRGTLADLMQDGMRLRRDELELPSTAASYLRLTLDDGPDLQITAAELRPASAGPSGEWLRIEAPSAAGEDGRWAYALGGPLPVEALRLTAGSGTQLFSVRVGGADSAEADDVSFVSGVLHAMAEGDAGVASTGLPLRLRDASWLLLQPGSGAPPQPLPLDVLLRPAQLRFVAVGSAPWQIAVGQFGLAAPDDAAARTLLRLGENSPSGNPVSVAKAELGEPVTLAGEAARRPGPSGDIVFWIAIIGGVLLLSLMLWRVIAEMRTSNATSGDGAR